MLLLPVLRVLASLMASICHLGISFRQTGGPLRRQTTGVYAVVHFSPAPFTSRLPLRLWISQLLYFFCFDYYMGCKM
jgi:hypothetical protein